MKKNSIFIALFLSGFVIVAQTDPESKIYTATVFKKGIYKTYDEFINNAPSITTAFTVREKNNMGEHYTFDTTDGSKVGKAFGFCDGTTIYVHGLRLEGFHKLDFVGRYSFFVFEQARYSLATAMLPDHFVIIDDGGTYRDGTVGFVTKFLTSKNANLGKEYEALPDKNEKKSKRKDFMIRLNEVYKVTR